MPEDEREQYRLVSQQNEKKRTCIIIHVRDVQRDRETEKGGKKGDNMIALSEDKCTVLLVKYIYGR